MSFDDTQMLPGSTSGSATVLVSRRNPLAFTIVLFVIPLPIETFAIRMDGASLKVLNLLEAFFVSDLRVSENHAL